MRDITWKRLGEKEVEKREDGAVGDAFGMDISTLEYFRIIIRAGSFYFDCLRRFFS